MKTQQHPKPEPRPTVGGSFTLDASTGKWLPTDEAPDAPSAPAEPAPLTEEDAIDG